jgi:signal transduction histidine kinase
VTPPGRSPPSLLRVIALRLAAVAASLALALVVLVTVEYSMDLTTLRRATLEREGHALADALRHGGVETLAATHYARYPEAYGYRAFDSENNIVAVANEDLFPLIPRFRSGRPDLVFTRDRTAQPNDDRWFVIMREEIAGAPLWIQVALRGDPAWLWREVLVQKVLEHVAVPVLVLIPGLTLAVFLVIRSTLRPLTAIAEQARALGARITEGRRLTPLSYSGLPRETMDLVGAMNAMLMKVDSLLNQQRQFTANAAHELRTPLAVLLLAISRLPECDAVARLRGDVTAMSRLVAQLLRLAQAEQLARADFVVHDLREISRAACEELAVVAVAQRKLIEFDEPPAPVPASCNADFLGVAIRNVIENALNASPEGATVSITVGAGRNVTIEDRGPGIPEADKDLVFGRLWRRARREEDRVGAGIGLALVRRILDLHNGTAAIEDREGGGARFVLSIGPDAEWATEGEQRGRQRDYSGRTEGAVTLSN